MRLFIKGRPHPNRGTPFREQLHEQLGPDWEVTEAPLILKLRFIFLRGSKPQPHPLIEAPLPGLVNGVLNELCGVAWKDAKQIVRISAQKEYGNVNATEIGW